MCPTARSPRECGFAGPTAPSARCSTKQGCLRGPSSCRSTDPGGRPLPILQGSSMGRTGLQLVPLAAPFVLAAAAFAQTRVPDALNAELAPRERISIDSGWRFHLGDPQDASQQLLYDLRPEVRQSAEGRPADAEPQEAARTA